MINFIFPIHSVLVCPPMDSSFLSSSFLRHWEQRRQMDVEGNTYLRAFRLGQMSSNDFCDYVVLAFEAFQCFDGILQVSRNSKTDKCSKFTRQLQIFWMGFFSLYCATVGFISLNQTSKIVSRRETAHLMLIQHVIAESKYSENLLGLHRHVDLL